MFLRHDTELKTLLKQRLNVKELRDSVIVVNECILRGEHTIPSFNEYLEKGQTTYITSTLLIFAVMAYLLNHVLKENFDAPNVITIPVAMLLCFCGSLNLINPLVSRLVGIHDVLNMNQMRREAGRYDLKEGLTRNLPKRTEIIRKYKLGNCFELSLLTAEALAHDEEIGKKYFITQVFLQHPTSPRNNHTVILVSDKEINLRELFNKTLFNADANFVVIDLWCSLIATKSDLAQLDPTKFDALVKYKVRGIDFVIEPNQHAIEKTEAINQLKH